MAIPLKQKTGAYVFSFKKSQNMQLFTFTMSRTLTNFTFFTLLYSGAKWRGHCVQKKLCLDSETEGNRWIVKIFYGLTYLFYPSKKKKPPFRRWSRADHASTHTWYWCTLQYDMKCIRAIFLMHFSDEKHSIYPGMLEHYLMSSQGIN